MPDAFAEVAMATLVFTVVGYSVMAWLWIASRWRRHRPLVEFEPRRTPPWGIVDAVVLFVAWLMLQTTLLVICRAVQGLPLAFDPDAPSVADQRAQVVAALWADLLAAPLALVWLRLVRGVTLADLGISTTHLGLDLGRGAVAFAAISLPVYGLQVVLTQFFPSHHPAIELLKENPDPTTVLNTVLMAALAAPLCEELLFRLVLQGGLEGAEARFLRGGNPDGNSPAPSTSPPSDARATPPAAVEMPADQWVAAAAPTEVSPAEPPPFPGRPRLWGLPPGTWPILASSTLFALMHWQHGPDPIPLFVLALALGYLYRQTHRLLPSITVHVLLNSCSLLGLFLGGGQ